LLQTHSSPQSTGSQTTQSAAETVNHSGSPRPGSVTERKAANPLYNIAGDKPYAQIAIEYATLAFSRTTSFAFLSFLIPRRPSLPGARIRIRLSRVDPLNSVSGSSNIRILTAAWKGKSWNFRLRQLTDRSHVDGPASTTHNSLSAWLAIVSARSKRSPRQETPTQSHS
jgi:hypothetical protein